MINISKEEESKCSMIKLKEAPKLKNHTPIGDKYPSKNNILVQDFKKKKRSLLNGIFYLIKGRQTYGTLQRSKESPQKVHSPTYRKV